VSTGPALRAASGGLVRHPVQTIVVFVVVAAASAAATLGLTLYTSANEGFLNAFAVYHGPDLAVTVDPARVTRAQLARTSSLSGVTQAAGPYPETAITLQDAAPPKTRGGGPSGGLALPYSVVGRASQGGPLDDLTLNRGRWPDGPGQIAIGVYIPLRAQVGDAVTATSLAGHPRLAVTGYGGSEARDEDAWVTPAEITALERAGAPVQEQMLYRFRSAATAVQINTDLAEIRAALPRGAVMSSVSWLLSADQTGAEQDLNTPSAVAFALLGLALAALIVGSVVSALVVAGYRRIGVLKSIGFTPLQVAVAYAAQVAVPTAAGCATGVILGNYWVLPMLGHGAGVFHLASTIPAWIDVAAPLGICGIVGIAALIPALRAGRLSAVAAIARGQAPRQGHGFAVHRLLSALPIPRPVTAGLSAPFSRPGRSALTLAAICSGLTAVILAVGLGSSLDRASSSSSRGQGAVQVMPAAGPGAPISRSQRQAVARALQAAPGTGPHTGVISLSGGIFNFTTASVSVAGLQIPLNITAYTSRSAWLDWDMISGRWFGKTGEIDVNTAFLTDTGLAVGDHVTLSVDGRLVRTRIVGQVYDPDLPDVLTAAQTLGHPAAFPVSQYDIGLGSGVSLQAYTAGLARALGPGLSVSQPQPGGGVTEFVDTSLIRTLTLMVAVLAALGILNSLLMSTRERVYDLGVFKALGMTPRQTITMVVCSVIPPALGAAVIALPVAIVIHAATVSAIGSAAGTGIPADVVNIYSAAELALLALAGLAAAGAGALLPASWAAATRTTTALRAE
jgi:putative ABC transport system permease protein